MPSSSGAISFLVPFSFFFTLVFSFMVSCSLFFSYSLLFFLYISLIISLFCLYFSASNNSFSLWISHFSIFPLIFSIVFYFNFLSVYIFCFSVSHFQFCRPILFQSDFSPTFLTTPFYFILLIFDFFSFLFLALHRWAKIKKVKFNET